MLAGWAQHFPAQPHLLQVYLGPRARVQAPTGRQAAGLPGQAL